MMKYSPRLYSFVESISFEYRVLFGKILNTLHAKIPESSPRHGGGEMKVFRLIGILAVAMGIAIFISVPAWANKSETKIEAPDTAGKGSEITIKVTVTHSANSFFHYTEWLWVQVNGKEIAKWEYSSGNRPEGATFTKEIKYKVDGDLEIKGKASCNMHGSANEAAAKVTAK
jgi:desulfoferrodoxin (superoxide reductase-like protein)